MLLYFQGILNEETLRELLMTMGDRFTDDEVNKLNIVSEI